MYIYTLQRINFHINLGFSVCVLACQCCSYMKTEEASDNAVQSHCAMALQEIASVVTQQVCFFIKLKKDCPNVKSVKMMDRQIKTSVNLFCAIFIFTSTFDINCHSIIIPTCFVARAFLSIRFKYIKILFNK